MISTNQVSPIAHSEHLHRNKQVLNRVAIQRCFAIASLVLMGFLTVQPAALAHHPTGGRIPANFFEGFLSGLAHPIIGLDHFAFVVAMGLLCVGQVRGMLIPLGFVLAALAGTGIHLLSWDLPSAEIIISLSVMALGAMLVMPNQLSWVVVTALGAVAGLFHGYAYGEAIIGASMMPLVAYLWGFTLIQYSVAIVAFLMGNWVNQNFTTQLISWRRLSGLAICSIGLVFLSSSIFG